MMLWTFILGFHPIGKLSVGWRTQYNCACRRRHRPKVTSGIVNILNFKKVEQNIRHSISHDEALTVANVRREMASGLGPQLLGTNWNNRQWRTWQNKVLLCECEARRIKNWAQTHTFFLPGPRHKLSVGKVHICEASMKFQIEAVGFNDLIFPGWSCPTLCLTRLTTNTSETQLITEKSVCRFCAALDVTKETRPPRGPNSQSAPIQRWQKCDTSAARWRLSRIQDISESEHHCH